MNERRPGGGHGEVTSMPTTWFDVYWFFRRKVRIVVLAAFTYAALC
jgi:hypothetical protein